MLEITAQIRPDFAVICIVVGSKRVVQLCYPPLYELFTLQQTKDYLIYVHTDY